MGTKVEDTIKANTYMGEWQGHDRQQGRNKAFHCFLNKEVGNFLINKLVY